MAVMQCILRPEKKHINPPVSDVKHQDVQLSIPRYRASHRASAALSDNSQRTGDWKRRGASCAAERKEAQEDHDRKKTEKIILTVIIEHSKLERSRI